MAKIRTTGERLMEYPKAGELLYTKGLRIVDPKDLEKEPEGQLLLKLVDDNPMGLRVGERSYLPGIRALEEATPFQIAKRAMELMTEYVDILESKSNDEVFGGTQIPTNITVVVDSKNGRRAVELIEDTFPGTVNWRESPEPRIKATVDRFELRQKPKG